MNSVINKVKKEFKKIEKLKHDYVEKKNQIKILEKKVKLLENLVVK